MTSVRHGVRAILFDGDDIILFRRLRPGREPYWITPGGGVEPTDASLELALRRELDEELGAVAGPALRVYTLTEPGHLSTVFVCRLISMDLSRRSGPEFDEPGIGIHEIQRVRPEKVRELAVVPVGLGEFIADAGPSLPALLDAATYAPGRHRPVVDVHLLVMDGDRVLLGRRQGTGYADGEWQIMPSGHLEEGEHVVAGAIREAREELGIEVTDCAVAHVMHHRNPGGTARIGFFLTARAFTGTPVNAEPDKCAELAWFPADRLPEHTVPYARAGIEAIRAGAPFSLHGWRTPDAAGLAEEAGRAGFAEVTVCLAGHRDGAVLVLSDAETDRLPATVVRPGETVEGALARLALAITAPGASAGDLRFLGADDYVSVSGVPGRRLTFAAPLAGHEGAGRWLPISAIGDSLLPYAERTMIAQGF